MRQANLQKVAQERTDENAVQFDQNIRYSREKVWPFWYGFIPRLFLNESTFRGGLGPLGWKVLPGETKDIHIKTRRDTAYRLLGVKYTPYICIDDTVDNPLTGTITLVLGSANVVGVGTLFTTEINVGQTLAVADGSGGFLFVDVRSITNNTNLVLDVVAAAASAGAIYSLAFKIWYDRQLPNIKSDLGTPANSIQNALGTIIVGGGSGAWNGTGTSFDSAPDQLILGDILETVLDGAVLPDGTIPDGPQFLASVSVITSDILITTRNQTLVGDAITAKEYRRIADGQAGTVTIVVAGDIGTVTGVGTTFTNHSVGDVFFYADLIENRVMNGRITVITDNTNIIIEGTDIANTNNAELYAIGISFPANPSLPLPTLNFLYRPIANLLTVTIILTSLQNRYQLGGTQYRPGSGLLERPENITALQGQDDGMGFIRGAALLPTEATVVIRITNNSATETIIVNGTLFGYKVSINEVSRH